MALILIIDDDRDTRDVIKTTLEGAGHEVILASDGREGVKLYRDRRADLVITDLFMPNQEGIETIKQMQMEFPDSAIIAMSGRPTSGTMLSVAKRLGATAALQKPFLPEELLKLVEQTL
jgi:DNA-binding NtrC family response regulator